MNISLKLTAMLILLLISYGVDANNSYTLEVASIVNAEYETYSDYYLIEIQAVIEATFVENILSVSILELDTHFISNVSTTQVSSGSDEVYWYLTSVDMLPQTLTLVIQYGGPCGSNKKSSHSLTFSEGSVVLPDSLFHPTTYTISCAPEISTTTGSDISQGAELITLPWSFGVAIIVIYLSSYLRKQFIYGR